MKAVSFFDGKAGAREALKRLNVKVEKYSAVEICPKKRVIADANHSDITRNCHDVLEWEKNESLDEFFDFVFAGFECTSLTSQGKRENFSGKSGIFFNFANILDRLIKINPNIKIFIENVASMDNESRNIISQRLGLRHYSLTSKYFSGQDRERYYWFNWPYTLKVFPDWEERFHVNKYLDEDGLLAFNFSKSNRNEAGAIEQIIKGRIKQCPRSGALMTGLGCNGRSTMNKVITKKMTIRDFTPKECSRLAGFPDYVWPCDDKEIFHTIGQGWQIDTIVDILKQSGIK